MYSRQKRPMISFLTIMILFFTIVSVTSCGTNADPTKPEATITETEKPASSAAAETPEAPKAGNDVKADLRLWVFAEPHAKFFEYVKEEFKKIYPNVTITVEVSEYNALFDKLTVIANSGGTGAPDMVDVEQGVFGRYITGDDIIFEPLNSYLKEAGKTDAISKGRQALYTWKDNIYGLEHALCPVVMAYRKDIFEENGITMPINTWEEFTQAGLKLKEQGISIINIHALPGGVQGVIDVVTRSADSDVVDAEGNVRINTKAWIDTAQMVYDWVNTDKIAMTYEADQDRFGQIAENKVVTMIAADWGTGWLKDFVPEQSGKWAVTSLPVLNVGDPTTSVWGGTGLSMIKTSQYKDIVWEFMSLAQLNKTSAVKRFELTNLYPPLLEAFDEPELNKPNEYYGGQILGKIYAEAGAIAPTQQPKWWSSLYGQAFEKYFFDFMSGKMNAKDFAKNVEDETKALIESTQK